MSSEAAFATGRRLARRGETGGRLFRWLDMSFSPAAAFLLLIPTIGYYTFAAYVNVLAPEGRAASIAVRALPLLVLAIAFFRARRAPLASCIVPATLFLIFYSYRLAENMLYLDMEMRPGNAVVLLTFFLSSVMPAYALAWMARDLRDGDMAPLLSVISVLFVAGMALNRDMLIDTAAVQRAELLKINPISLAYTASSFFLFYVVGSPHVRRIRIEALLIVPVLLLIVSLARSRGMIISTCMTLALYLLVTHGTKRLTILAILAAIAVLTVLYADPEYLGGALNALGQIGQDRSTEERQIFFRGALDQFLQDPLFGRYAVERQLGFYPHNIYLEALMAVGMVGAVPFFLHVALALRAAIGLLREREGSLVRVFVALLFIRDAVGAAASGSLWNASGFWITSFLVIALWYGRKRGRVMRPRAGRDELHPPPHRGRPTTVRR